MNDEDSYAESCLYLVERLYSNADCRSVVMLSVVLLSAVMLSVVMLSVVMLSAVMLSVFSPFLSALSIKSLFVTLRMHDTQHK